MSGGRRAQRSQQSGRGRRSRNRRESDAPLSTPRRHASTYRDKSVRVIYFAAEGAKTEYDYVRFLEDAYGRRSEAEHFRFERCHPGHKNGLRPVQVVDEVLSKAGPGDEKWVMFDRDAEDNRDGEIRDALRKAAEHGVQVALSHPSFELWLLLHFQHFTSQEHGLNEELIRRLRGHRQAVEFKEYDGGAGKGLNRRQAESLFERDGDRDRVKQAVRNARKLVDSCPYDDCSAGDADTGALKKKREEHGPWTRRTGHAAGCDPLLRDPSTDVWRLLTSLDIGNATD